MPSYWTLAASMRRALFSEESMLDAVMLVAGVAFFALAIAYVAACDRM
jgi:hypothetical protein